MRFYVEVHEARLFALAIDARSPEEAKARALELASAGELDAQTLDREVLAVEMPEERAA